MPDPALRRRRLRAWGLAAVLGLHLLGLGLTGRLGAWRDRGTPPPEVAPLIVHLLWPASPAPGSKPSPAAAQPLRPQPPAQPPTQRQAQPQPSITGPAESSTAPAPTLPQAITLPREPSVPASSAPPPPLNLALPRSASAAWRQRSPALDDARSNTARGTLESHLADAMGGDGRWVEERVDLDHVRYHRGSECIEATRTRAGQLDLSGGAFRNLWAAKKC